MLENKLNFINLHEHPEYDMDIEGLNEYVFPGTLATTSLEKDTLDTIYRKYHRVMAGSPFRINPEDF